MCKFLDSTGRPANLERMKEAENTNSELITGSTVTDFVTNGTRSPDSEYVSEIVCQKCVEDRISHICTRPSQADDADNWKVLRIHYV